METKPRSRKVVIAFRFIAGALVTFLAGVLILNLYAGKQKIQKPIPSLYSVNDPQFARAMGHLFGPPLAGGNQARALLNGDGFLPAMLSAINGAKRTITFESYIYWSGKTGQAFADAFSKKAREGVKVHLIFDNVGSRVDDPLLDQMKQAGVQVHTYQPVHWYNLSKINNRTHRKLLVIDGKIGFTGGMGIADKWMGNAQSPDHWRDTQYRIEGPAVAQMQAAFLDHWILVSSDVLHGDDYFPPPQAAGPHYAQVLKSSPENGSQNVQFMYLLSIASAKKNVRLSQSYFIPDKVSVETILEAVKRGVTVEVIVPGPYIDHKLVRHASRSQWGELIRAGVKIYEYQPTMYHCKVMIVDDAWVSVGSTNFDNRSFRLNAEANLNVLDRGFAAEQIRIFEQDKAKSRLVTYEEWKKRPWTDKVKEFFSGLLRSQL